VLSKSIAYGDLKSLDTVWYGTGWPLVERICDVPKFAADIWLAIQVAKVAFLLAFWHWQSSTQ
jgi:hypothetical protein